jgi:hypothetical protein
MVDSKPLSLRPFRAHTQRRSKHTGPAGSMTNDPVGSDFTLARGKFRSQRDAFKSVRGSNEGVYGELERLALQGRQKILVLDFIALN